MCVYDLLTTLLFFFHLSRSFPMSALQLKTFSKSKAQPITKLTVSQRELEKMNATDGDFMWEGPDEGIVHVLPGPDTIEPKA